MKVVHLKVAREVLELINNPDALSMDVIMFKHGGTTNAGKALCCKVVIDDAV